jgi:hypothetical protein
MQRLTYAGTSFVIDDELFDLIMRVFDVIDITGGTFTVEVPVHFGDGTSSTRTRLRLIPGAAWVAYAEELPRLLDKDPVGTDSAKNGINGFLQSSLRSDQIVQNRLAQHGYFAH